MLVALERLMTEFKNRTYEGLSPFERRYLADALRWMAGKVEPKEQPKSGLLVDLQGRNSE